MGIKNKDISNYAWEGFQQKLYGTLYIPEHVLVYVWKIKKMEYTEFKARNSRNQKQIVIILNYMCKRLQGIAKKINCILNFSIEHINKKKTICLHILFSNAAL